MYWPLLVMSKNLTLSASGLGPRVGPRSPEFCVDSSVKGKLIHLLLFYQEIREKQILYLQLCTGPMVIFIQTLPETQFSLRLRPSLAAAT